MARFVSVTAEWNKKDDANPPAPGVCSWSPSDPARIGNSGVSSTSGAGAVAGAGGRGEMERWEGMEDSPPKRTVESDGAGEIDTVGDDGTADDDGDNGSEKGRAALVVILGNVERKSELVDDDKMGR